MKIRNDYERLVLGQDLSAKYSEIALSSKIRAVSPAGGSTSRAPYASVS